MTDNKLKAAILVISDTASVDPSTDKAGEALSSVFATEDQGSKWERPIVKIVPDNVLQIQRAICDWADGPNCFNLIVTTGGTGFTAKDNTPEVRGHSSCLLTAALFSVN